MEPLSRFHLQSFEILGVLRDLATTSPWHAIGLTVTHDPSQSSGGAESTTPECWQIMAAHL
jgi:hypothetical protein